MVNKKVLIVGDNAIDRYHWCNVKQFNPEGIFPILNVVKTEDRPGMAGNVYANLKSFDFDIDFIHGEQTSIKNRYMDMVSRRCFMRLDQDEISQNIIPYQDVSDYDAIIISDYNKGTVTPDLIDWLKTNGKKVFIDTKIRDLKTLEGCTVKINHKEYTDRTSDHDDVIVTLGNRGAMYQGKVYETEQVDAFDVCGAGDTFLAALVAGWIYTNDMTKAIELALRASTIAVQHIGTYALTKNDVKEICEFL